MIETWCWGRTQTRSAWFKERLFEYLRLVTFYTEGLTLQHINKLEENSFGCKVSRLLLLVDLVNDAELLSWVPAAERTGR